tara:strand:- start:3252 stop:4256 length:1005 start_codon:yes stop_codon:yes gene_type:complete
MEKYIITNGCSFTRQHHRIGINGTSDDFLKDTLGQWRWPHHIKDIYKDANVINLGCPTNDNEVIALSTMDMVNKLLKSGVSSDNILVITQWSESARNSFFISKEVSDVYNSQLIYKDKDENAYAHVSAYLDNCDSGIGKNGYFIQSGGYSYDHVLYKVVDLFDKQSEYISAESKLITYFRNILLLQNFLKLHNIDSISFNISYNLNEVGGRGNTFSETYDNIITKNTFKGSYDNPYVQSLFNLIDMESMWLYNDGDTNIGGITEWAIKSFDKSKDKQLFMEHDIDNPASIGNFDEWIKINDKKDEHPMGHVSEQMNKKFVKTILNKKIEKYLDI